MPRFLIRDYGRGGLFLSTDGETCWIWGQMLGNMAWVERDHKKAIRRAAWCVLERPKILEEIRNEGYHGLAKELEKATADIIGESNMKYWEMIIRDLTTLGWKVWTDYSEKDGGPTYSMRARKDYNTIIVEGQSWIEAARQLSKECREHNPAKPNS